MTRARDLADSADKDIAGTLTIDTMHASDKVAIGTTNPSASLSAGGLHVTDRIAVGSGTAGTPALHYDGDTDTGLFFGTGVVAVGTGGSERMRIDSSGRVGIGTTSMSSMNSYGSGLTVGNSGISGSAGMTVYAGANTGYSSVYFGDPDDTKIGWLEYNHNNDSLSVGANNAERMRIDSSGNLLVGTTAATAYNNSTDVYGFNVYSNGQIASSVNNEIAAYFNRQNGGGTIADFRKDGSSVGIIGVEGADLTIGNGDVGLQFVPDFDAIRPINVSSNAVRDAAVDLGRYNGRFKDLYLSGGIYVGGTDSANKLDDYEEGTFTPTFGGTTGDPTVTYATQSGHYTKVGNLVTCFIQLRTSAASGGSGVLLIEGLPFAVTGNSDECGGSVGLVIGLSNSTGYEMVQADSTLTSIIVLKNTTNSGHVPTDLTSNTYFRCSIQYLTTA